MSSSASPITTGEIANGMSTSVFSIALPRKFWRTRTIAARTPKIVFSGTAIATVISVSFSAASPFSLKTASNDSTKPASNVR